MIGVIGRSVPRLEDGPLLKGQGLFAADISFPDMLHMSRAEKSSSGSSTFILRLAIGPLEFVFWTQSLLY